MLEHIAFCLIDETEGLPFYFCDKDGGTQPLPPPSLHMQQRVRNSENYFVMFFPDGGTSRTCTSIPKVAASHRGEAGGMMLWILIESVASRRGRIRFHAAPLIRETIVLKGARIGNLSLMACRKARFKRGWNSFLSRPGIEATKWKTHGWSNYKTVEK